MWGWIAGGAALLFLVTRKPASPFAAQPAKRIAFNPGDTKAVNLRIGEQLIVDLPPGHTYHVDDFAGGGVVVGFVQNPANPSTGYNSFTITGMAPGNVQIQVDTRNETFPMFFLIGVA